MSYADCPACSSKRLRARQDLGAQINECRACGAIFGTCYLGDSYNLVRPFFSPSANTVPAEQTRYFDFTCLGSTGITRRHGWFNLNDRTLVQVG